MTRSLLVGACLLLVVGCASQLTGWNAQAERCGFYVTAPDAETVQVIRELVQKVPVGPPTVRRPIDEIITVQDCLAADKCIYYADADRTCIVVMGTP